MFCPGCGSELPDGAQFCGSCGTRLEGAAAPVRQPAAMPAQVPGAVAGIPATPAQPAPIAAAGAMPGAYGARKSSKKPLIAGIAAVAVVAAVGIGVYLAMFAPYNIDEKNFPDGDFRSAVSKQVDKDRDGKVSRDEAKMAVSLDLSGSDVESLEGIRLFPNLERLDLSGASSLSAVDLSTVPNLQSLDVTGTGLKELDVSALAQLESLHAADTRIKDIDLSANTVLAALSLPQGTDVEGLSSTGVREQWLLTTMRSEGYAGTIDAQAGGMFPDDTIMRFGYDDEGNLVEYSFEYHYDPEYEMDDYTFTREFGYDDEGRLASCASSTSSVGKFTESTVSYNDDGLPSEVVIDQLGSSSGNTVHRLNYDGGKLVEVTSRYGSGSSSYYIDYNYDDEGRFAGTSTAYSDVVVKYDDAGRVIEVASEYQAFEFDYDDADNVVEKRVYWLNDGKKSNDPTVIEFEYDKQGRLASANRHYENTGEYAYAYNSDATVKYDDNGNLASIWVDSASDSDSYSYYNDGTMTFSYERIFTADDADDVIRPYQLADPTNRFDDYKPLRLDLFGDDVPEVVRYCFGLVSSDEVHL